MTEPCTRRSTETPGNRRRTVSRWLTQTPNGCGNNGRPPCRHRDLDPRNSLVTGYVGSNRLGIFLNAVLTHALRIRGANATTGVIEKHTDRTLLMLEVP